MGRFTSISRLGTLIAAGFSDQYFSNLTLGWSLWEEVSCLYIGVMDQTRSAALVCASTNAAKSTS